MQRTSGLTKLRWKFTFNPDGLNNHWHTTSNKPSIWLERSLARNKIAEKTFKRSIEGSAHIYNFFVDSHSIPQSIAFHAAICIRELNQLTPSWLRCCCAKMYHAGASIGSFLQCATTIVCTERHRIWKICPNRNQSPSTCIPNEVTKMTELILKRINRTVLYIQEERSSQSIRREQRLSDFRTARFRPKQNISLSASQKETVTRYKLLRRIERACQCYWAERVCTIVLCHGSAKWVSRLSTGPTSVRLACAINPTMATIANLPAKNRKTTDPRISRALWPKSSNPLHDRKLAKWV